MDKDVPGSSGTHQTGSGQDDYDELVATENAWARAIVSNDADRIAGFVTADWAIVSESGTTSGGDFLSLIRSGDLSHSAMTPLGDWRVRVYEGAATVTARMASTATYRGRSFDANEWTTDLAWLNHHEMAALTLADARLAA